MVICLANSKMFLIIFKARELGNRTWRSHLVHWKLAFLAGVPLHSLLLPDRLLWFLPPVLCSLPDLLLSALSTVLVPIPPRSATCQTQRLHLWHMCLRLASPNLVHCPKAGSNLFLNHFGCNCSIHENHQ